MTYEVKLLNNKLSSYLNEHFVGVWVVNSNRHSWSKGWSIKGFDLNILDHILIKKINKQRARIFGTIIKILGP